MASINNTATEARIPITLNEGMFSSTTDKWNTPQTILAAVIEVMGGIDLDPCSNSKTTPNVPATLHYTEDDDGLLQPWRGRVFMNPPYGRAVKDWVSKFLDEYKRGNMTEGFALVRNSTGTRWFRQFDGCYCCFLEGRLHFNDSKNSAPFDSCLIYVGPNAIRFGQVFSNHGMVWRSVTTRPPTPTLPWEVGQTPLRNPYDDTYIIDDCGTDFDEFNRYIQTTKHLVDAEFKNFVDEEIERRGIKVSFKSRPFGTDTITPYIADTAITPATADVQPITSLDNTIIINHPTTPTANMGNAGGHKLNGRRLHAFGMRRVEEILTEIGYTVTPYDDTTLKLHIDTGHYYLCVRAKQSATWHKKGCKPEFGIDEAAFREFDKLDIESKYPLIVAFYVAETDEIFYETLDCIKHHARTSKIRRTNVWLVPKDILLPLKTPTTTFPLLSVGEAAEPFTHEMPA